MADYKVLTIPFARDAVPDMVNDIPNDPSISEPQLASFKQGFPSITTIPLVAGGIPPEGQDFNGILRDITQHIVHQNKGGMYKFAPEVVAAGGYPEGAVLAANDGLSLWVSLVDDNVQDFNIGTPTQWARIAFSGLDSLLNGKVDKASIVQATGASTTNIMSQKAVTDAIENIRTSGIPGSFSNLKASATGTNSIVTVAADALCVKNSANEQVVLNSVSVTPSLSNSGANGLDNGASAVSTWYSVWIIYNPTTLAVAGLLSLSATAPTLPAGYTHKARVGWIRTDATANKFPLGFIQAGRRVQYRVAAGSNVPSLPVMASGVQGNPLQPPAFVAVGTAAVVPPTAGLVSLSLFGYIGNTSVIAAPNSSHYGVTPTAGLASPLHISQGSPTGETHAAVTGDMTLESSNIYYASSAPASGVACLGWEDNL